MFTLPLCTFSQKKVKQKYVYDVEKNAKTRKVKKELYRIYKYDRAGFVSQIITYGKTKQTIDTIVVYLEGGAEEKRIVAKYAVNMKKIGRIEQFTKINDSSFKSKGYEIWNDRDTFKFENLYHRHAPETYAVESVTSIPYGKNNARFYDDYFEEKYTETHSHRTFNDNGQIEKVVYHNESDSVENARTVYFYYNMRGQVVADSTVKDRAFLVKNRYEYNRQHKIIAIEKMFIRNSQFIQFNYNENGDLAKKYVKDVWMTEYKYQYY
ncbi:MAG: hypothetical protein IT257_01820 [Chitinophagaceae bacterium]|nr:hypothetical protein [Chitinophagaceae bacterium]